MRSDKSDLKAARYCTLVKQISNFDLSGLNRTGGVQLTAFSQCQEVNLWSYWEGGVSQT